MTCQRWPSRTRRRDPPSRHPAPLAHRDGGRHLHHHVVRQDPQRRLSRREHPRQDHHDSVPRSTRTPLDPRAPPCVGAHHQPPVTTHPRTQAPPDRSGPRRPTRRSRRRRSARRPGTRHHRSRRHLPRCTFRVTRHLVGSGFRTARTSAGLSFPHAGRRTRGRPHRRASRPPSRGHRGEALRDGHRPRRPTPHLATRTARQSTPRCRCPDHRQARVPPSRRHRRHPTGTSRAVTSRRLPHRPQPGKPGDLPGAGSGFRHESRGDPSDAAARRGQTVSGSLVMPRSSPSAACSATNQSYVLRMPASRS